jgi:hypothetical protein
MQAQGVAPISRWLANMVKRQAYSFRLAVI